MEKMDNVKFCVVSYFYGKDYNNDLYSKNLSKILNEGIWKFIVWNKNFKIFLLGCLDNVEKQVMITGQHISDVHVTVRVFDRNCDVDEMVCKDIRVVFNTTEGTNREFEFKDRIPLSDFNLPSKIAVNGTLLIEMIGREVNKKRCLSLADKYGIFSSFLMSLIVSYLLFDEIPLIFIFTCLLGIFASVLVICYSDFWCRVWRYWRGYECNNESVIQVNKTGDTWTFPSCQNLVS